jgi:hypothetical protein
MLRQEPAMLRTVWSRFKAIVPRASVHIQAKLGVEDAAWSRRQLYGGPAYRIIRFYNWVLGVSGGLALLGGKLLGSSLLGLRNPRVNHSLLGLFGEYIQGLLVANAFFVGVLIVRGPWARDVLELVKELAKRQSPAGNDAVEPSFASGALLVVRVATIAPLFWLVALLLAERRIERFFVLAAIACLLMIAVVGVSTATGLVAMYIRRIARKYAAWTWIGLWVMPELIRYAIPGVPTPRTLIVETLKWASLDWGLH